MSFTLPIVFPILRKCRWNQRFVVSGRCHFTLSRRCHSVLSDMVFLLLSALVAGAKSSISKQNMVALMGIALVFA